MSKSSTAEALYEALTAFVHARDDEDPRAVYEDMMNEVSDFADGYLDERTGSKQALAKQLVKIAEELVAAGNQWVVLTGNNGKYTVARKANSLNDAVRKVQSKGGTPGLLKGVDYRRGAKVRNSHYDYGMTRGNAATGKVSVEYMVVTKLDQA